MMSDYVYLVRKEKNMSKIKNSIYNFAVRKNENVRKQYEEYVINNIDEHKKKRLRHWRILVKLNWHYRVRKKTEPLVLKGSKKTDIVEDKMKNNVVEMSSSKPVAIPVPKPAPAPAPKPAPAPVPRNPILAYSDGPESEAYPRTQPHHMVKRLLEFDVISFDIFDTLILRPFSKPTDMFYLLDDRFDQHQLHDIRINCEKRAREISINQRGNREVTLEDIYNEVEKLTGINKNRGMEVEFELEKKLCFANPYMKRVFDILKSCGKTIYATSDMYLPKKMMSELLESCGYVGFEDVIVSCDYNTNKHQGGLFDILLQKVQHRTVIHVGDNFAADITKAKEKGIETYFYKGVNAVGNTYRADGISELIGSGYAGIINAKLHCGLKKYPVHYEYGYVYGGLYILGYCNYIANFVKTHNIDKVLFVSRDGDIYSKVFDMLHKDIPYEYVYWSRMANIKAMISKDRFAFLNRLLDGKIANYVKVTISSLFVSAGLESLLAYLDEYRLNPTEYLSHDNKLIIRELLIDHYDEIVDIYEKDNIGMKEYYQKVIGSAERVVIVDVGWTGSNVIGLSTMLEKDWGICKRAYGMLAASNGWNSEVTSQYDEEANIQAYLFGRAHNRAHFDGFVNNHKRAGHVLFEIMTQSQTPSFVGIGQNQEFIFDVPEVENYHVIEEMHRGVIDFVKEYTAKFGAERLMMNISGYDAYCPFRKVYRNLDYHKNFFGDFVFTTSMFSDKETQTVETLRQFFESKGL